MILQSATTVSGVCLSYFTLGGILFLGAALGYAIAIRLNRNPSADLTMNLITNKDALRMIANYKAVSPAGDSVSGHLELGVLMAYISRMQTLCTNAGREMSGVEYYFARYGANDEPDQNRNTIVMYPTYAEGGAHIPFDPTPNISVVNLNTAYQTEVGGGATMAVAHASSMNVLNRTNMSPPRQPLTL